MRINFEGDGHHQLMQKIHTTELPSTLIHQTPLKVHKIRIFVIEKFMSVGNKISSFLYIERLVTKEIFTVVLACNKVVKGYNKFSLGFRLIASLLLFAALKF